MPYFILNNKKTQYKKGETILQAAKRANLEIPTLCYHPDFKVRAVCRICVVEVKGRRDLVTACSTQINEGMEVKTHSLAVKKARGINLELIFASHKEECSDCVLLNDCPLLKYAKKYQLSIGRFIDRKNKLGKIKFSKAVEIDRSQCIDCGTCVEVCKNVQKIDCLEFAGKGYKQKIRFKKENPCIYCGQCALHCPVFSAQEQTNLLDIEEILKKKKENKLNNKILVAQIAPSVRASISEVYNKKSGEISVKQMANALKKLGFDYVFDVNFAADLTTIVEAEELVERLSDKKAILPLMTSCCPAWVRYVEVYRTELMSNLTSSRSPQMHSGALIKYYFSHLKKIRASDIILVSIMPCTAKKHEAKREELKVNRLKLVDYVLTVREFSFILQRKKINLFKLKEIKLDNPLSNHSGSAAMYGGSGGVMESALRQVAKDTYQKLNFKSVRGQKGLKEASFKIKGRHINIAVVSGIGNIAKLLDKLDKYHYVEVMACPGGCIGGGGQIIPTNNEIIEKRAKSLYNIDNKSQIKLADENIAVKKAINWFKDQKLEHKALHTIYKKNNK
jgi:NADP-reducing hydrogenase subunit HndD